MVITCKPRSMYAGQAEGVPGVAHLVLPRTGQRQLAPSGHAKQQRALEKMEEEMFDGQRPEFGSVELEPAFVQLAEYEVERCTQELVLLVSRFHWIQILYNKLAERPKEVKSLDKAKAKVAEDIKSAHAKVISWISSATVQTLATRHSFSFVTRLSEVRQWSIHTVFAGVFPWTAEEDVNVHEAMKRKLAQRLRVANSVRINNLVRD